MMSINITELIKDTQKDGMPLCTDAEIKYGKTASELQKILTDSGNKKEKTTGHHGFGRWTRQEQSLLTELWSVERYKELVNNRKTRFHHEEWVSFINNIYDKFNELSSGQHRWKNQLLCQARFLNLTPKSNRPRKNKDEKSNQVFTEDLMGRLSDEDFTTEQKILILKASQGYEFCSDECFQSLKKSHERKNKSWSKLNRTSIDKIASAQKGCSIMSGESLIFDPSKTTGTASVDRINNNEGYHEDNIQLVTKHENEMRGSLDFDSFIEYCINISLYQLISQLGHYDKKRKILNNVNITQKLETITNLFNKEKGK